MNRNMWILLALVVALSLAAIWREQQGLSAPSWTNCTESLFTQVFTGNCTQRLKGDITPS